MTAAPTASVSIRTRCTPSELRIQWSAVCSGRGGDAAALERLHRRIDEAIAAIDVAILSGGTEVEMTALRAEIGQVREIDAGLRRMRP